MHWQEGKDKPEEAYKDFPDCFAMLHWSNQPTDRLSLRLMRILRECFSAGTIKKVVEALSSTGLQFGNDDTISSVF